MGLSSIDVPHLAIGGMPDISPPILPENSSAFGKGTSALGDLSHFGTVDLATDHGNFRAIAHEDVVKCLSRAAIDGQTFSTGKKPGWYGGRG